MLAALLFAVYPNSFLPCDVRFDDGFVALEAADHRLYLLDSGSKQSLSATGETVSLKSVSVPTRRVPNMFPSRAARLEIAGVIGNDLLATRQFIVDYRKQQVFMNGLEPADPSSLGFTRSVPLEAAEGVFFVHATVGSENARLLVDTGANILAMSPAFLERVKKTATEPETLSGFEGAPSVKVYRIPRITVGALFVPSLRVFEEPNISDDGTIGAWLFSRNRLLLDFGHSKIWIPEHRRQRLLLGSKEEGEPGAHTAHWQLSHHLARVASRKPSRSRVSVPGSSRSGSVDALPPELL